MNKNFIADYGILTAVPQEMIHYYNLCENREIIQIGNVKYLTGLINHKRVVCVPTGIGTTCAAVELLGVPSLVVRGVSNIYSKDGVESNISTSEIALASGNAAKFVMNLLVVA